MFLVTLGRHKRATQEGLRLKIPIATVVIEMTVAQAMNHLILNEVIHISASSCSAH